MTTEAAALVRRVRTLVVSRLATVIDRDLDVAAGAVARTCRETLAHMVELPHYWSARIATRSRANDVVSALDLRNDSSAELVGTLDAGLAVLGDVILAMAPDDVAAHAAGLTDSLGWACMIADEELVHLWDIGQGLDLGWTLPEDTCAAVLRRLFPWAGDDGSAQERLLWVNGRAPLADKAPLRDWVWHCANPEQWDGRIPSDETFDFLPLRRRSGPDPRLKEVNEVIAPAAFSEPVRDITRLKGDSKKGVYRVTLAGGTTAVLYRWHRDENYWPEDRSENADPLADASSLDLFLASHARLLAAGVRVPRQLNVGRDLDKNEGWAVVEDVRGGTLEEAFTHRPVIADRATLDLATQVRAMQSVTNPHPGKVAHVALEETQPHEAVRARADADLADASLRVTAIGERRRAIGALLDQRFRHITARERFALIHGELGPDHVLLDEQRHPVLIDIEGAMFFDVEWEHAFLEIRFGPRYAAFAQTDLDPDRLAFYRLSLYLSLVAGPLRLLDGDFPDRAAMFRIADANVARVLKELG